MRDDPELDFDRAWQQPAEVAGEPQPDEGPAGDLELELDLDRSWNKKS